uniref:Uncharacterized protein n=1 Tax=Anguilla anguilla TaxID=7936 RepID=A0A0E9T708_ANGAN
MQLQDQTFLDDDQTLSTNLSPFKGLYSRSVIIAVIIRSFRVTDLTVPNWRAFEDSEGVWDRIYGYGVKC